MYSDRNDLTEQEINASTFDSLPENADGRIIYNSKKKMSSSIKVIEHSSKAPITQSNEDKHNL